MRKLKSKNNYQYIMLKPLLLFLFCSHFLIKENVNAKTNDAKQKIMLSLLLDTSNSMDGLIDQAKSQLWTIINELAMGKGENNDKIPIQIALYEYGNSSLPSTDGYIRMVLPLTDDLDNISEKLFGLTTNGGDEFCGQVIQHSISQLDWTSSDKDLKMIFIAGNEPFTQGNVPYDIACRSAKERDIIVSTIYCGEYDEGVSSSWRAAAMITGGSYMNIQQNEKTVYMATPYDEAIDKLNDELNSTYVYYGQYGKQKKEVQEIQDFNSSNYGRENKVKRAISKSSHAYRNSSWDLVDALKEKEESITSIKEEYLPQEMKGMSLAERESYVKKKAEERKKIQKEIQALGVKRKQYISEKESKDGNTEMLDDAVIRSIKELAKKKNITF